MLRVTNDIVELRHWAEERGGRPCRKEGTGRLSLVFAGELCDDVGVGWDEFEPTFCACHCVFVYDDAPDSTRHFIGCEDEARAYVAAAAGAQPPQPSA